MNNKIFFVYFENLYNWIADISKKSIEDNFENNNYKHV